jgi:hypothetical protein
MILCCVELLGIVVVFCLLSSLLLYSSISSQSTVFDCFVCHFCHCHCHACRVSSCHAFQPSPMSRPDPMSCLPSVSVLSYTPCFFLVILDMLVLRLPSLVERQCVSHDVYILAGSDI